MSKKHYKNTRKSIVNCGSLTFQPSEILEANSTDPFINTALSEGYIKEVQVRRESDEVQKDPDFAPPSDDEDEDEDEPAFS